MKRIVVMLRANKVVSIGLVIALFTLLVSFQQEPFSKQLREKVDRAVATTYDLVDFDLEAVLIPSDLSDKLEATFIPNHFFKIMNGTEMIGYIYVGDAASMKRRFDFVLLLNADLSIKKSKVLIYREDYGLQIGSQRWLKQFIGLTPEDEVSYGTTIDAIAGATISASSMTKATAAILKSINVLRKEKII